MSIARTVSWRALVASPVLIVVAVAGLMTAGHANARVAWFIVN